MLITNFFFYFSFLGFFISSERSEVMEVNISKRVYLNKKMSGLNTIIHGQIRV